LKPDDKWTVPLCHEHHMEQHSVGEVPFFEAIGIDPIKVARELYDVSPDLTMMIALTLTARD
jgi:hypothetical protein